MSSVPFHPAMVHLPLGVAPVVLLSCMVVGVGLWRGALSRQGWWVPVSLQAVVVVGVLVSRYTGESDAEGLFDVVGAEAIGQHNSWANGFSVLAVVTLVLILGAAVAREPRASAGLGALGGLAAAVLVWLGVQTGHSGGELVWTHGAAWHAYEQSHQTSKALDDE